MKIVYVPLKGAAIGAPPPTNAARPLRPKDGSAMAYLTSSISKVSSLVSASRPSLTRTITVARFGRVAAEAKASERLIIPSRSLMVNQSALAPSRLQRTASPSGSLAAKTLTSVSPAELAAAIIGSPQSAGAIILGARFGSPKASVSVSSSVNSPSVNCTVTLAEHSSGASEPPPPVLPPPSEAVVKTRRKSPIPAVRER